MKHIIDDRADIVNLNNEELYLAGRLYNLEPFAMEQYNGGKWLHLHGARGERKWQGWLPVWLAPLHHSELTCELAGCLEGARAEKATCCIVCER